MGTLGMSLTSPSRDWFDYPIAELRKLLEKRIEI